MNPNLLNTNRFSGLAPIDPSSLEFPLGAAERTTGMYKDIHEGEAEKDEALLHPAERQNQGDFGRFLCEAGQREHKKGERRRQQSGKPKCEGYIQNQNGQKDMIGESLKDRAITEVKCEKNDLEKQPHNELEHIISDLKIENAELKEQLMHMKKILDLIYNSKGWKMLLVLYKLKSYICRILEIIKTRDFARVLRKFKCKKSSCNFAIPLHKAIYPKINANKYSVIFFSIINWDFRTQRPQHLARRFAANGCRVLYVSVNFKKGILYHHRKLDENLYEIVLPFSKDTTIYNLDINSYMDILSNVMDKLLIDFSIKESIAIVEFPLWYPLVKYLKTKWNARVVFDCLDEFSEFKNIKSDTALVEIELLKITDCCIATSSALYEKSKTLCKNVTLIKNATEFDHFNNIVINDTLRNIKKPIIGYYGTIAEWFDIDLIEYVALNKPEYSIVLIGHTFGAEAEVARLKKLKNIYLLGEQSYQELPKYLYWFDVCLIPFKLCDLIKSTDPVKFYEYISAGKPVVSVKLPQLLDYSDLLYLSDTKEEFLNNIEKALVENNPEAISKRIEFAKHNDWNDRFNAIQATIKPLYPRVSIIIVTFNNLQYTQLCLESIYQKTAYPNFELIVVDNASTDETRKYLDELKIKDQEAKIIFNPENLGFAAANNIGIKNSTGEYVILLNNDTIVTSGWIGGLLKYLNDPAIGMVGPVTNSIGNEAKINVSYDANLQDIDDFAEGYTNNHRNQCFNINMLAMFCVALRKETINEVGLLDEEFAIGMFEDDDYSMRIKQKGLRIVCAEDVFIHHFGSASFGKMNQNDCQIIFRANKEKYEKKWGRWQPHKLRN